MTTITIQAETADELKSKVMELASVFGGATVSEISPPPIQDPPVKKRNGPKPKVRIEEVDTGHVTPPAPVTAVAKTDGPTIDDIKQALSKVAGKDNSNIAGARKVLEQFEARRLSEVKPEDYTKFIAVCGDAMAMS